MSHSQTPYSTPERGIRFYKTGVFAAIITRSTPCGAGVYAMASYYSGGHRSIEAARAALARLDAEHPKRKPGRKPGPQRRRALRS